MVLVIGNLTGRVGKMGDNISSHLNEHDEEPSLHIDENAYEIHSLIADCQAKDALGRPVLIFDRWKILQSDIESKRTKPILAEHDDTTDDDILLKLNANEGDGMGTRLSTQSPLGSTENEHSVNSETKGQQTSDSNNSPDSGVAIIHNSRPSSLPVSCIAQEMGAFTTHWTSNQEVLTKISAPNLSSNTPSLANVDSTLVAEQRSASVDTLLEGRPSLQQRRNKRPKSLQIPSLLSIPPPPVRTAHQFSYSQDFSFTR